MAAYGFMILLLLLFISAPLLIICQQQTLAVAAAVNDHPRKHDGTPNALYDDDDDEEEEAGEDRYAKSYRHEYDDDDEKQYHAPPARHHDDDDDDDDDDEDRYGTRRSHSGGHRLSRHGFVLDLDDDDRSSSLVHTSVFSSEAGEYKFLFPRDSTDDDNYNNELAKQRIGLSFLTLEPNALLLPQYTDSDCLFVVNKGRGLFSWIDGEDLQKLQLEEGDVYRIESGAVFYFLNNDDQTRKMHVFGIHDLAAAGASTRSGIRDGGFFNVAGADTILSGFDEDVLSTAFNVSGDEVYDLLTSRREEGPIIIYHASKERNESSSSAAPSTTAAEKPLVNVVAEVLLEDTGALLLQSILKKEEGETPAKKPLNIFQKKPIFTSEYGSTSVADETDSELLKHANKGVFSVKLNASAMLAPHWNPRGMEIALVTKGEGDIQVVHASGSSRERVREGSVFYVPRNFAMCQAASTNGPLEFVGFSTSSRPNHPQFLAGSSSVLKKVDPDVVASAFNVPADYVQRFLGRQTQAVIVPTGVVEEEEEAAEAEEKEKDELKQQLI